MQLTPELKAFIREHASAQTDQLLLSASRFPGIDLPFAVDQILARRQIRNKLPEWFAQEEIIYPSRLATEQCSSALTGRYKQRLVKGRRVCDLTGGLGADSYYFSHAADEVVYVERSGAYCSAARHNFGILQAGNIRVVNADARELLPALQADTFYIDPARRSGCNKRAYALSDCEPDVLQLKPMLLEQGQRVIVKISPMADLEETLRLLPETREIHILAVKNECKELLFILEAPQQSPAPETNVFAVHLQPGHPEQTFVFPLTEEKKTEPLLTETTGRYLYEPHAALLKSGAFKLIASRFHVQQLHRHSHLYTSTALIPDFPGRCFTVEEIFSFSGKLLRQIGKQYPKANLTTRNFPLSVAELRKRSGLKEGGDLYLFATTLSNGRKILIQTHKINPDAPQTEPPDQTAPEA